MFKELVPLIQSGSRFLITAHIHPEGDCVGSVFAVDALLTSLGKETCIVCQDPVPQGLSFLGKQWQTYSSLTMQPNFDWAIVLDAPTLERVGTVTSLLARSPHIINIDHHISNNRFGAINIVNAAASSCGEMIFDLYQHMHIPITPEVAMLLYMAISTDTGSFRYQNTTGCTHRAITTLIDTGFDLAKLNEQLYSCTSITSITLLGQFLNHISFSHGNIIAWSYLTQQDLNAVGATTEDTEGFIDMLRDINGVEIAFFAFALNDTEVKISFRSKGMRDVNAVARAFGGGGHIHAAGCTIRDSLASAIHNINVQIEQLL